MTEDSEQSSKENKENTKNSVSPSTRLKNLSPNKSTNSLTNSQKKDKSRETQQTRVVIRHLPPTMTSEEFLEAISPIPEHNDYYFCRADTSLGAFGFCRAYINFLHMEDLFVFKDKFDGYVFVDSKGNEFIAIVEFSPFQRIPRRRFGGSGQPITAKKRDNKCGTIEQDSDYLQFLEDVEKMKSDPNLPSADVYLEEIEARDKQIRANHGCVKVSTPLIEFIKNRKHEKIRLREERREERKKQLAEQKRIREEEQQKKLKVLKNDENKSSKDSDQKSRDRTEKSTNRSEEDRLRHKARDSERKNRNISKNSDSKRTDAKKSEKKYSHKSEKSKDSKEKESTFVVKVVQNTDETKKSDNNTAEGTDLKKSDNNKEQNNKSEELKDEKSDKLSKNTKESSSKSEDKRIRNKDRPTREIYRPGATKRGTEPAQSSQSGSNSQSNANKSDRSSTSSGYKQRVFTRSKH